MLVNYVIQHPKLFKQRAKVFNFWFMFSSVAWSCPTLCDLMDYPVHGILQVRMLEWVAFPFSRESSQPRDRTQVSCITGVFFTRQILYQLSHKGSPRMLKWVAYPLSKGSSWSRNRIRVSCIAGQFFINWAMREAFGLH